MMLEALTLIGGTIATLLLIANPCGTAPVFAAMTRGYAEQECLRQARMAVICMTGMLLVTLFAGALVLKFLASGYLHCAPPVAC